MTISEYWRRVKLIKEGRTVVFPPQVDPNLGRDVTWEELRNWFKIIIPRFEEESTFTFADAKYKVYSKELTLKAIAEAPKPLYNYTKEQFDCDDFAEWRKLVIKQVLISCPVLYCEGVTERGNGHAWNLVPHEGGVEYLGISGAGHINAQKIYFVRI